MLPFFLSLHREVIVFWEYYSVWQKHVRVLTGCDGWGLFSFNLNGYRTDSDCLLNSINLILIESGQYQKNHE